MQGFTRVYEKGLQSRSATASLLIMKEKIEVIVVLAQKIRIMGTHREKWRHTSREDSARESERNRSGIGAMEKDMQHFLYIISIVQITG